LIMKFGDICSKGQNNVMQKERGSVQVTIKLKI